MSDVHANPRALKVALEDARRLGCGKYVLLGDVTGYGYDVKTALSEVRKNFDVVLMGNHDSACIVILSLPTLAMNTLSVAKVANKWYTLAANTEVEV